MNKQEHNKIKKIEEIKEGENETKIVLLYGFSNKQLNDFIDQYKKNKNLPKTIFAKITTNSINMKIQDIIKELEMEKKSFQQDKTQNG